MVIVNYVLNIMLSLIMPVVLMAVGLYFKTHYMVRIGECGIVVPAAQQEQYKWLYAQIIGPKIAIKYGGTATVVICFVNILLLVFGHPMSDNLSIGAIIGGAFLAAFLISVENQVDAFKPDWIGTENEKSKEMWVEKVLQLIDQKDYARLDSIAKDCH